MRGATRISLWALLPERYFNPHSPCGERPRSIWCTVSSSSFQSTLPMRGATGNGCRFFIGLSISIHTPHAGSDSVALRIMFVDMQFQSTLPMRGATAEDNAYTRAVSNFNPHSPCGERRSGSLLSAPSP